MYSIFIKQKSDEKAAHEARKQWMLNHEEEAKKQRKVQRQILSQNYFARVEDWMAAQLEHVHATGQLINPPRDPPENPANIVSFRPKVEPQKFLGSASVTGTRYVHELERVETNMKRQQEAMAAHMPFHPPQNNEMRQRKKAKELSEPFRYTHRTEPERVNAVVSSYNLTGEQGPWKQNTFPTYRPKPDPQKFINTGKTFQATFVPITAYDRGKVLDVRTDMSSVSASDRWYGPLRFEDMMRYPLDEDRVAGRPAYRTGVKLRLMYQSMAPDLRPPTPVDDRKTYWGAASTIAHCNFTKTDPDAVPVPGHTIFDTYTKSFPDKSQTARELVRLLP